MAGKRVVHQKAKGPIDPSIGLKVRELRTARGMTQAQLAGPDFSKGFISLLETGRTRVSLRAAHIIASRLGVDVTELLAGTHLEEVKPLKDLGPESNKIRADLRKRRIGHLEAARIDGEIEEQLMKALLHYAWNVKWREGVVGWLAAQPDPDDYGDDFERFKRDLAAWREAGYRVLNALPKEE